MKQTEKGRITEEYLNSLEEQANKYPKPWQMGVGSYTMAALISELRELRKANVRERCGVCGEKGNHGGVAHEEAVRSRLRDWPQEMLDWLRNQINNSDDPETVAVLYDRFRKEYKLDAGKE